MKIELKDKKMLITGASRGLGSVCAKALAEQGGFFSIDG